MGIEDTLIQKPKELDKILPTKVIQYLSNLDRKEKQLFVFDQKKNMNNLITPMPKNQNVFVMNMHTNFKF